MIEVREVKTNKEIKEFIEFPLNLYKNNGCFVPPLYSDEKKMFKAGFVYADTCIFKCYNAYKNGKIVGRIQAIIQKASNQKTGEKRVRFDRFDSINDSEVSKALFAKVEEFAKENGMNILIGPLGFSDLEREGLLIEGFDELSTFEEQYNAEYYKDLIEAEGFQKEVDWLEFQLRLPEIPDDKIDKTAEFILKKYNLHLANSKNVREFLNKYKDKFFDLLDRSYKDIYGTVPFTDNMKKNMIDNFSLIIDLKYVAMVLDENENVVLMGVCFPSIAKAVQKSGGRLTIPCLIKILKTLKKPEVLDLGLVGVDAEYMNKGITAIVISNLMRMLKEDGIEHLETNLNLEDNFAILNCWKRFDNRQHKKRRSYVKYLGE